MPIDAVFDAARAPKYAAWTIKNAHGPERTVNIPPALSPSSSSPLKPENVADHGTINGSKFPNASQSSLTLGWSTGTPAGPPDSWKDPGDDIGLGGFNYPC